jgi:prophage regulatory protein
MARAYSTASAIAPEAGPDIEHGVPVSPVRPSRFLRLPEVKNRVGVGRSTLYRWMEEGRFPRSVQLSQKCVVWRETDIDEWIDNHV